MLIRIRPAGRSPSSLPPTNRHSRSWPCAGTGTPCCRRPRRRDARGGWVDGERGAVLNGGIRTRAPSSRARATPAPAQGPTGAARRLPRATSTSTWVRRRIKSKRPARGSIIPRWSNGRGARPRSIERCRLARLRSDSRRARPRRARAPCVDRWDREGTFEQLRRKPRVGRRSRSPTGRSPRTTRWACITPGDARSRISSSAPAVLGEDRRYQNGFDCQGLWVEVEVEKALGLNSKHGSRPSGSTDSRARAATASPSTRQCRPRSRGGSGCGWTGSGRTTR